MPKSRKRNSSLSLRYIWPVLMVGLGLVTAIAWTVVIGWYLFKFIEWIV
jgi:hypothetical protein